ncbi:hypothetical protein QC761_605550 [Podospora bellae-mahoneyi]|uniref:Zn(2)-C6 fungal-type domain-containing protein n=1 Tax=Podospora bellae-mahoneyi TaxID=2093777 RepID=A0ABR0F8H3_9PEZI|nr:hypothetical protein QC761_605550 [Podospora bellae-mahoneyi]
MKKQHQNVTMPSTAQTPLPSNQPQPQIRRLPTLQPKADLERDRDRDRERQLQEGPPPRGGSGPGDGNTMSSSTPSASSSSASGGVVEKPYHAKRPHRKSRTGCRNCKSRKVKCDEAKPSCRACTARNDRCVYPVIIPTATAAAGARNRGAANSSSSAVVATTLARRRALAPVQEPEFIPMERDELEMRLLWIYTNNTYTSYSSGPFRHRMVDHVLRAGVIQHAFAHPFLMNTCLAMAAQHINRAGGRPDMHIPPSKELAYRVKALESFRKAVEKAEASTYPALIACAYLLTGLSTYMFRNNNESPTSLVILDWMTIWRGIGAIIDVTKLPTLAQSGLLPIIFRPDIDMKTSISHCPAYLLDLANTQDPLDTPFLEGYRECLHVLGSVYKELRRSGHNSHMFIWRVMTFFTFLGREFVTSAHHRRPPALTMIAHYLAFTTIISDRVWWLQDMAPHQIPRIFNIIAGMGPPHTALDRTLPLEIPIRCLDPMTNDERSRLVLQDPDWVHPPDHTGEMPVTYDSVEREYLNTKMLRGQSRSPSVSSPPPLSAAGSSEPPSPPAQRKEVMALSTKDELIIPPEDGQEKGVQYKHLEGAYYAVDGVRVTDTEFYRAMGLERGGGMITEM